MIIGELIELLQEFDPEKEIIFDITKGSGRVRQFVSIDGLYEVRHPEGPRMISLFSDLLASIFCAYLIANSGSERNFPPYIRGAISII